MSTINNERLTKGLRWAGKIIALPVATFFFVFMIGEFISSVTTEGLQHAISITGILGCVTTVIALVGCIISWWWLLPAGILLIFAYLFGAISSGLVAVYHVGLFNLSQWSDFWTIPGILYLISGVLFLVSWCISKKKQFC
jgi:hypothetical protein